MGKHIGKMNGEKYKINGSDSAQDIENGEGNFSLAGNTKMAD